MSDATLAILIIALLFLLGGWVLRRRAATKGEHRYIVAKATPLPVRLVTVRDDVWIRGTMTCESPLSVPHFGTRAAYFEYTLEEETEETTTDSQGNTQTSSEWKTIEERSEVVPFAVTDPTGKLAVATESATFEYLEHRTATVGSYRHTARWLPASGPVSVIGSVGEGGATLEAFASIPLVVTPLAREVWIARTASAERWSRRLASVALLIGFTGAFWLIGLWAGFWDEAFAAGHLLVAAGAGLVVTFLLGAMSAYNHIVTLKARVLGSWKQIDVDLKMRFDLIPKLVETVKATKAHEHEVFTRLAELRTARAEVGAGRLVPQRRLDQETALTAAAQQALTVIEDYPELKADKSTAALFKTLLALEEKIAHARAVYNSAVREYNTRVEGFPTVVLATITGAPPAAYWNETEAEAVAEAQAAPSVGNA